MTSSSACDSAQRRPGREPRRHLQPEAPEVGERPRSTKAGARTPATPSSSRRRSPPSCSAQRRPGREPRRHARRPTSVGVTATAQRRPGREPRRHRPRGEAPPEGDHRSTKAGARTPATLHPARQLPHVAAALNEGRGANPGDTAAAWAFAATCVGAQRRPGREPRRHCRVSGTAPDDLTAQRRPGREPRRHTTASSSSGACAASLNEGRGANPGDTGPERRCGGVVVPRSTKAGARTPATP